MAQLITVRLDKAGQQPLGFRLQGGKDFGTPLVVQKVNGGSAAERAGLQAGDALIRVNTTEVYALRHQEAQDAIRASGPTLELTVQRGGGTWRPSVTPTGSLPRPGSRPLGSTPTPVTNTSLKATPQPSRAFGSGHNNVAKPFGYMNGNDSVKSIVNKQYNTPVNMYSDKTIAETLSAQTEVLAGGVLGVNFKKNEKTYDAEKSAVFKVLQEAENDPEPEASHFYSRASVARGGTPSSLLRTHRSRSRTPRVAASPLPAAPSPARLSTGTQTPAPEQLVPEQAHRPSLPVGCHRVLADGRVALGAPAPPQPAPDALPVVNDTPYCSDCNRYIIGVFVRIKDKNLHVECFKCSTCGTSLKNQGYYNINGKLYCDIHAKLVARQNPPAPNLDPVTVPPGGRIPSNTYATPLPPLATGNYTNGSSSLFSPSSNLSGPKPFGSSIGSAYSPSLSPRSAPLSPARPVAAPAAPAPAAMPTALSAPLPAPAPAPLLASAPVPAASSFAPINEIQSPSMPHKTEFKSQAEERLIRKMAKMALNGYEIGIQRKIKPADHIQSMADKIQDTVVTKHPLNTESLSSGENSRDNTLKKVHKIIGDRVKDPIALNHPSNTNLNDNITPIPPPLPTTPIPTCNIYNTSIGYSANTNSKKIQENIPRKLSNTFTPNIQIGNNFEKTRNGNDYSSLDDTIKDKFENNYNNTLRKKADAEKSVFLNDMNTHLDIKGIEPGLDCSTLNKRKMFEKNEQLNLSNITDISSKNDDKIMVTESTLKNKHNFEQSIDNGDDKNKIDQDENSSKEIKSLCGSSLQDNSLYCFKAVKADDKYSEHLKNETSNSHINKQLNENNEKQENSETETVVKRRQKKCNRNDDGRRDSHIIARPLSTMTSVDVADGLYPVCHKCDKAITRGPFITALGRIWCPEHFICVNATCRRALQDIGFVEENGQLYCEFCFEQYIAPSCDKCHAKIKGDCLNAIGKHFHPECFSCVYCGKLFGNNPFFLEDGLPYCEADWNELFTTKCFACGFPVEAGDRWVEALNNNYHSQCFNCTVCKKNLEGQSFFAKGGRPFCKSHAR
ncbi:PDZ and LIM domain protein Zasp isoform X2 [Manduca sexta]|uniref:PDZ and LIM domain protein Zasp isoform X2 n=1 Tax=Manduca sexta TaxID=7130 RepID=UPI00188FEA87|nr:PDZ and LIM domain protein Zasp isoform X2 [Manduca sexta]XP_030026696.2 PDZ and LIM domain protein Zasp isoform X2 [Manduca sexta]